MHAALVTDFDHKPRYADVDEPQAVRPHEEVVEVLASALHPRVRSQADGSHYTSTDALPLVPGVDGVGRRDDGSLIYFVVGDTPLGALAEKTVVDLRRTVPLPADADAVLLAAVMNPTMSSWVALTTRVSFRPGQSVLVLGATGAAGQLAIQVARHFGAGDVVAAGRDGAKLARAGSFGASATVDLSASPDEVAADLAAKAAEVDVVLDYLWGEPAQNALMPLLLARADRSRALDWIQIGSSAGAEIALPSAALRQANFRFLGSGQGSVSTAGIVSVLPDLVAQVIRGGLTVEVDERPLSEVEAAWSATGAARVVFVP